MKKLTASLFALLCTITATAQPRANSDGTVTFSYKNDSARNVMVDVQFCGRKEMKRGADGTWTVTVGPAAPDMYPYCYIVDGLSVTDPENPQYFPNEGFKSSLLEIPAKEGSLPHDIRNVPHGRLEYIHYYSKSLGSTNQAVVYLPPRYWENQQKRYPVFYLISGTTDTEEVYYKVGRVNYILDNLIADKQAREMIVVLPYGNPTKLLANPPAPTQPQTKFGGDVFSLDLINDLMPYIDRNYRTHADRNHRAIGGFSRGGNQALYNGLTNLDKFSYLCSYSSFTSTDIPQVYDNAVETNKKINLFWLGVGTDDFLYGNARDYMEFLDKKGIRSVKVLTSDKYGHTWMNAKYFLAQSLPLLFKKKAAEAAMKEAQPAPAATGQEKQFTPGVMARLFPKPLVSPEYTEKGVTFRLKAPEARHVELDCEMLPENKPMQRDTAGVWSITMSDYMFNTFKYCFVVDGTRVADPQNMLLSPDRGFKYSIAENPKSPFNFASMGDIQHGRTGYDVERQEAWYMSPMPSTPTVPAFIQLVPGEGDTMESWFKVGGADAIADRLVADGKTRPCVITTSNLEFMQQSNMPQMPDFKVHTLRAADYPTWPQRRRALFRLLIDIGKQPAPQAPVPPQARYPWQNPDTPTADRVENLLSMLTPEEKVGLMMNKSISIDRLGIPSYNWWSEACHGVVQDNYTVYPQPIGMAAAFNAQLVRQVFTQVSDEARANWNRSDHSVTHVGMGEKYYPGNPELSFWCPNVNIFRDPRWGRGQETCGEDPYLNAVLGVETVLGMQSPADNYYKTHACAKHYAVHSGPEPLRHSMNVEPTNRDLWETYLPAFKALVKKGNVREVMCAYQRFEGKPCCTSDRLLIDILRNKWGYDGLVVTDCDAINNFFSPRQHETHKDGLSASVDAVLNGTDLECGKVFMVLTEALQKGLIKEADLDGHLRRTLTGRFQLGMFDPADRLPWAKLGEDVISSEEHHQLATQAAREAIVLLENKRAVLPLSKSIKTLAVVGPNADDVDLLNGNYGGKPTQAHKRSLLEGIRAAVPGADIIYEKACELKRNVRNATDFADASWRPWRKPEYVITADFDSLAQVAAKADAIVIIGGISSRIEGEGGDKQDIELPAVQQQLVRAMHKTGRPVIFVNCSGSAIAFGSIEGQYDALVQAWYPGEGGSQALAEVLFGDYTPGGKLPVTFYRSTKDLPDFMDYSMKNRTYRYFTGKPQYAFGYGLSYTTFRVEKGTLSAPSMKIGQKVQLSVPVSNTGKREGTETIQLYVKALDDAGAPLKALKGFQKVSLQPGERKIVSIELDSEAFEYYDETIDELSPRAGRYQILYGTSSRDEDLQQLDFRLL